MAPGQLRLFNYVSVAANNSLFLPGQVVLLLRQDPTWATGRWHVLCDGREEICDEHTIIMRTSILSTTNQGEIK